MSAEKIIQEMKKGQLKPIYWLEGDEEFFIDQVTHFAENKILNEAESGFNLTVIYGKDADWATLINACRRYPMFSERQVVILKEAQAMRDILKLESYIDNPLTSTVLVVAYKNKKVDGRTKMSKLLKEKGVVLSTRKLYDNEMPEWTQQLVQSKGLSINSKALHLLIDHIGNDLSRLNNEVDKLTINLENKKAITEDDIEKYIGVSKEYNVFELQNAIAQKDIYKAMRIVQYFASNPKAAPIHMILPALYSFFSKVMIAATSNARDEKSIMAAAGANFFQVKDIMAALRNYGPEGVEKILLLLHKYNLKSIGINDTGTDDADLLKEMLFKMMHV